MGDCPVMKAARPAVQLLLSVPIGEHRAFFCQTVNVRCAMPHDAVIVGAKLNPFG
jgi:hypothetical protein